MPRQSQPPRIPGSHLNEQNRVFAPPKSLPSFPVCPERVGYVVGFGVMNAVVPVPDAPQQQSNPGRE
jgi:hypothetical protein